MALNKAAELEEDGIDSAIPPVDEFLGGGSWEYDAQWCNQPSHRLHIGDFNGDGQGDWLCHDVTTGYEWIDFADFSGLFMGTDWERDAAWCNQASGRVYKGDFNGDSRTDLLCHDADTGYMWIDYSDTTGPLLGADWDRDAEWCNHDGAQLHVGDFNGDGRDDLLCHDTLTGHKWLDYASASGHFLGTDWDRDAEWCNEATSELRVGDFNGDGHVDWLCRDTLTGYMWIDYASLAGRFMGTNWERDAQWCFEAGVKLYLGDFSGDGRVDMLCHDSTTGYKRTDYANVTGRFYGTNWEKDALWCFQVSGEIHTGDFDGNGETDLLCHDTVSGYKWITYNVY